MHAGQGSLDDLDVRELPASVEVGLERRVEAEVGEPGSCIHGLPPGTYLVEVGTGMAEVFWVSKIAEAGTTDAVFEID